MIAQVESNRGILFDPPLECAISGTGNFCLTPRGNAQFVEQRIFVCPPLECAISQTADVPVPSGGSKKNSRNVPVPSGGSKKNSRDVPGPSGGSNKNSRDVPGPSGGSSKNSRDVPGLSGGVKQKFPTTLLILTFLVVAFLSETLVQGDECDSQVSVATVPCLKK